MTPTSQFTQAPPIAGPRPPGLSGGRPFRVAILAVAASLLTVAPAPSWGHQGSGLADLFFPGHDHPEPHGDLRDAIKDLNETILESVARRQHDELWDLSYQDDYRAGKDERWVLPRPGSHDGSSQQQRTDLAASPPAVARAPSSEQQGSDPRDDIELDVPRVTREPPDLEEAILYFLLFAQPKGERWGLSSSASDATPPEANAGSGQQRRTDPPASPLTVARTPSPGSKAATPEMTSISTSRGFRGSRETGTQSSGAITFSTVGMWPPRTNAGASCLESPMHHRQAPMPAADNSGEPPPSPTCSIRSG